MESKKKVRIRKQCTNYIYNLSESYAHRRPSRPKGMINNTLQFACVCERGVSEECTQSTRFYYHNTRSLTHSHGYRLGTEDAEKRSKLIEATRMIALCVRNECQPARTITNPIYYADENERIEHMFPDSPIQKKRISIKMHEILLALLLHLHLHVSFAYIESFHFKWNTRRRKSTNDSASAAEK